MTRVTVAENTTTHFKLQLAFNDFLIALMHVLIFLIAPLTCY